MLDGGSRLSRRGLRTFWQRAPARRALRGGGTYAGCVNVRAARALASLYLGNGLDRRWKHVQAVAARATKVAAVLELDEDVVVSAAWLHDIGYAPGVVDTGFHPLDGARFLRQSGVDERIAALVAHHSCALIEADERGLDDELASEFPREESGVADALWYCDMTTGPDGEPLPVSERLNEVRSRYGPAHVVTRFVDRAEHEIVAAVRRTEERLEKAGARP
jgi:putative nucleotidyltransferase with HDIG domain